MANQIVESNQELILSSLSCKLANSLEKGLLSGIDVAQMKSSIEVKLLNQIDSLEFDLTNYKWHKVQKLSEADCTDLKLSMENRTGSKKVKDIPSSNAKM